jgi:hexulose-6-phosphate isomerase
MRNNINPIGIMQGRLSPPIDGRIQCFPAQQWEDEFPKARECGFELLEWIFGPDAWEQNPILSDDGINRIRRLSERVGVRVISLCADYFMFNPLVSVEPSARQERMEMLKTLIRRCSSAGVKYVMIPFVDNSAVRSEGEVQPAVEVIKELIPTAEESEVILTFETALSPAHFRKMIDAIAHPHARITFDIGDRASLGYHPLEEIAAYGEYVATVHIKDRRFGGGTVPLGTGSADFVAAFRELAGIGYTGPLIIQAAREGNEMAAAKKNLAFVKKHWAEAIAIGKYSDFVPA